MMTVIFWNLHLNFFVYFQSRNKIGLKMNTEIQPPEGKKCFSGIPEAHFIDDVDSYMKGEENSEVKMKELDEVGFY